MAQQNNSALLKALQNCITACDHCAYACLQESDVTAMANCIKTDIDCADFCSLVVRFVARGSEHAKHILQECVEICEACAAECEKHAHHMEHCRACAEACRKCAEACRQAA